MRNVREMSIILIDVTNICNRQCSNCTRFCGHFIKEKLYFMPLDYIEQAIYSLRNFPRIVGIMGGEPTLHPDFVQICKLMEKIIPDKGRRGLWTNTNTEVYRANKDMIDELFGFKNINDHVTRPVNHTPILTAIEDFKDVTEKEKLEIIDKCWVQNLWSATVTPRGAYFCEVAGCMANLFDGPMGLSTSSEWWKLNLDAFSEQIKWACKKCGCAIPLRPRKCREETDDVSPSNLKRLQDAGSPKIKRGKYEMFPCSKRMFDKNQVRHGSWYWD